MLLTLGEPIDIGAWADWVRLVCAQDAGVWELPVLGPVTGPAAALIRPDGYVAWAGDHHGQQGLAEALNTWFGPMTR